MGHTSPQHFYLVAIGSNLGHREQNIAAALDELQANETAIVATAPLYETKPLGAADQPFLNSATIAMSAFSPDSMLKHLLNIETRLGRVRRERWGNRIIDLDLLLWASDSNGLDCGLATHVFHSIDLTIPHPEMLNRDFVLVPASAIAGQWIHPESGLTLREECLARNFQLQPLPRF